MAKIVDLDENPDLAALAAAIGRSEESEVLILEKGRPLARLVPVAADLDEERERARDLLTGA